MTWEEPNFVEIKMDSEVSSYQEDWRDASPDDARVEELATASSIKA